MALTALLYLRGVFNPIFGRAAACKAVKMSADCSGGSGPGIKSSSFLAIAEITGIFKSINLFRKNLTVLTETDPDLARRAWFSIIHLISSSACEMISVIGITQEIFCIASKKIIKQRMLEDTTGKAMAVMTRWLVKWPFFLFFGAELDDAASAAAGAGSGCWSKKSCRVCVVGLAKANRNLRSTQLTQTLLIPS